MSTGIALAALKYRTIFKLLTIVYITGITLDILFNKRKSYADKGFSYAVAKYWNDLPEPIRKAKDIKKFKSLLKAHFFKLPFPTQ